MDIADEAERALAGRTSPGASVPVDGCLLTAADIREELREELRTFSRESLRSELSDMQKNLRHELHLGHNQILDALRNERGLEPLLHSTGSSDQGLPGQVTGVDEMAEAVSGPTGASNFDILVERHKRELKSMFQDLCSQHTGRFPEEAFGNKDLHNGPTIKDKVRQGSEVLTKPARLEVNHPRDSRDLSGVMPLALTASLNSAGSGSAGPSNSKAGSFKPKFARSTSKAALSAPRQTAAMSMSGVVPDAVLARVQNKTKNRLIQSKTRNLSFSSAKSDPNVLAGLDENEEGPRKRANSANSASSCEGEKSGEASHFVRRSVFMNSLNKRHGSMQSTAIVGIEAVSDVVYSTYFDLCSGAVVILNAAWIGVQTDYAAVRNTAANPPGYFQVIDTLFCLVFTGELISRMLADGRDFLTRSENRYWNAFDSALVSLQIMEEFMSRLVDDDERDGVGGNFSFLRMLRILKLIRVIRLVRIVRLIGEFKTIVSSIVGSLKSLLWTLVLLIMFIYVVGIFFTQCVVDYSPDHEDLDYFFGSLGRALLSLFEAFTGGADWDVMAEALISGVHPLMGIIFAFYIAFAVLAMMNVVTGVFVENALATARQDKDCELITCLNDVFHRNDDEEKKDGMISREEFTHLIQDPAMVRVLEAIDVAVSEAQGLFELIDVDTSGEISRDEFIMGCLRLKGAAKAMDLATLMYDNRRFCNVMEEHMNKMEAQMWSSEGALDHLTKLCTNSAVKIRRLTEGSEEFATGFEAVRTDGEDA